MLFDGFDVLFNIAFALIFCSVFIILGYSIITSITTWNTLHGSMYQPG